jgi:hypothetical protein
VVGPVVGKVVGPAVGKVVGPVVGKVVGPVVGKVVGPADGGLADGDADDVSLAWMAWACSSIFFMKSMYAWFLFAVLVLLPLDSQMLTSALLLLPLEPVEMLLLLPLEPLKMLPFIIPFIIIPLPLSPCFDFPLVRRFPFELTETSPLAPVTRRSSRTAVRVLECTVIMVKEIRCCLVVVGCSVRLFLTIVA